LFKSFPKPAKKPLASFQSGGRCPAQFSKKNCSSEAYLVCLTTGEMGPDRFAKALVANPRNPLSNRSEGLELASFKKLSAHLKLFALNG
jgi:hypothetical protein